MREQTFSSILVPVDFSEVSAHALRLGALLWEHCGQGSLVALHASAFEAPAYFTPGRIDELRKEFADSLEVARQSVQGFARSTPGLAADSVAAEAVDAPPADAIRHAAEAHHADVIVMGTHGRGGLNRWMAGSVTERVLRESAVPVLTVRSAPPEAIRRVLCPVHDTSVSRRALELAARISACFGASLTALHVVEPSGRPAPNLCDPGLREAVSQCSLRETVRHGDTSEEILRLAEEESADLIVLGAPRRRFFEGMALGTTTLRTVRHASCPVLSVGPERAQGLLSEQE